MAPVIELCRRCGYDIPADAACCPGCGCEGPPSLLALQVAGLALPSRSVHPLPSVTPRREREARTVGPARGARSAFQYTSLLVLLAVVGAVLGWVARLERYVPALPQGTADRIDAVTEAITWAAVAGLGLGLLAMAAWSVRRVVAGLAHRRRTDHLTLP